MPKPCRVCVTVRDAPIAIWPMHLVHPEHGKRNVFDVRGEAVCPDCGARWRSNCNNTVELLG